MTFSVEIVNSEALNTAGHYVEIYIDKENIQDLIDRLIKLSKEPPSEDLHFMSESWGLGDLSESPHAKGNIITHHLKFIMWD